MPDRDLLYKITAAVYAELDDSDGADEQKVERMVTGIYRAIEPYLSANESSATSTGAMHTGAQNRLVISVFGLDHAGIVSEVSKVLAESGCSIIDINQTLVGDKFAMVIIANTNEMKENIGTLKEKFKTLGERLGVRIYAQREDLFNSMHRI
ncbi:MAG TPA: ACT domain-containing protein [Pyrinomonadaceae bacterium]|jgi:ACT domain-containing protein|nr:ACT domain-containing protein [Pyrinomonadaceae bacterium]